MKALLAFVIASTIAVPTAGTAPADAPDALELVYATAGPTPPAHLSADVAALPPGVRGALDGTLRAYLAYEAASRDIVTGYLLTGAAAEAPWHTLADEQERLRDAGLALEAAVAASEAPAVLTGGGPADLVQIELQCDSDPNDTYTDDAILIIDLCGDDTYLNNAGGTVALAPGPTRCDRIPVAPNVHVAATISAAVIDGDGSDHYTPTDDSCGVNGGGALGAGFLLDTEGDDEYVGGNVSVNGGGHFGSGFLLDLAGNDTYTAWDQGVNGGGYVFGHGSLIDARGDDTYTVATPPAVSMAATRGVNGGGFFGGVGFLADLQTKEDFGDGEAALDCGGDVCLMATPVPLGDAYGTRIDLA